MIPIPTIDKGTPVHKSSLKHLDSLFGALQLALNLRTSKEMTPDLISILASLHTRLVGVVERDGKRAISLYKQLSAYFVDYIRGIKPKSTGWMPYDWNLTHNRPALLVDLLAWYDSYRPATGIDDSEFWFHLQVVHTFLQGHRVILTPMEPKTGTITEPSGIKELPNYTEKWPEVMSRLGITPDEFQRVYKSNCAKAGFSIITTAGPNGQATWTADIDAKAIKMDPNLFNNMYQFAEASNLTWMIQMLLGVVEVPYHLSGRTMNTAPIAGKIHAIQEWGGKTRMVAILDYWTQAILSPLHDTVAYFIRRLDADGTFNQTKIIDRVQKWTGDSGVEVYSYDLTAATDRIPIGIQTSLLTYLFGSSTMAENWAQILTCREYQTPDGSMIKYAVGQPMGAKSSFPMLGLIHHAIVQLAAIDAKVDKYSNYVVLGDDNTHADKAVANQYKKIMKNIGVEINESKSVVPVKGALSAGEICKRIFVAGRELTALPVKALVKTNMAGHLAPTLQNLLVERGLAIRKGDMPAFFYGLIPDKKAILGLFMLNKVDTSISGLKDTFEVTYDNLNYDKWFEHLKLTNERLLEAHVYALVTEQLKRVDSLLRATMVMGDTIQAMVDSGGTLEWPAELFVGMDAKAKAETVAKLPKLVWCHPVVAAANKELDRVLSHLTNLRAGTQGIVNKAKTGLLDILRNSLSEIWMGEAEKTSVVRRSIFNAMMANLKKLNKIDVKEGKVRELDFSILLTHVQRMWTVHWEFGKYPVINAVKTRVSTSVDNIKTDLGKVFDKVDVGDLRL